MAGIAFFPHLIIYLNISLGRPGKNKKDQM